MLTQSREHGTRNRVVIGMRYAWLFALFLSGCGEPPVVLHTVSGQVTKAGKPVAGGVIQFVHEKEPGVRAVGEIAADGRYNLRTLADNSHRTGVQAGPYRAT